MPVTNICSRIRCSEVWGSIGRLFICFEWDEETPRWFRISELQRPEIWEPIWQWADPSLTLRACLVLLGDPDVLFDPDPTWWCLHKYHCSSCCELFHQRSNRVGPKLKQGGVSIMGTPWAWIHQLPDILHLVVRDTSEVLLSEHKSPKHLRSSSHCHCDCSH